MKASVEHVQDHRLHPRPAKQPNADESGNQSIPLVDSSLPLPASTRPVPEVAHPATETRPVVEAARVHGIEVLADDCEQPGEVNLRASRVRVELDLWRLGFHQAPDLQAGLLPLLDVPEQVGIAAQLDLMGDFQRLGTAAGGGLVRPVAGVIGTFCVFRGPLLQWAAKVSVTSIVCCPQERNFPHDDPQNPRDDRGMAGSGTNHGRRLGKRRNPGAGQGQVAMVARRPVRHVHSLGTGEPQGHGNRLVPGCAESRSRSTTTFTSDSIP